jgi:hypothetical protein
LAVEQDLPLVGEVPEEGSFRDTDLRGDLGRCGPVIAALPEQLQRCVPFRLIAEAIGRQLGVPAKSLTAEEATFHFGGLAMFVAGNGPASNAWTREILGWTPREVGIIADIGRSNYSE